MRLLLVDDDAGLRALLRTTFEAVDIEVEEAESAQTARTVIAARRPDAIVLDVRMPGLDGRSFCRAIKNDPSTRDIGIVLLTGSEDGTESSAREAGADAFMRKPFSPLELLAVIERLVGGLYGVPSPPTGDRPDEEQLIFYARDLRHMLELERGQRLLLQKAYMETVEALASALDSKDVGTGRHSKRVQQYAIVLARAAASGLMQDASTEFGFLLHDVGKIGIPDEILHKRHELSTEERRLMRTHVVLGEQMLSGVAFLRGEGLRIVRCHHERWDGRGYPDGLRGDVIPLGARIFAVADALDAMTTDRPYRTRLDWTVAAEEITTQAGRQFDPTVVAAFCDRERELRTMHKSFALA